ncbi:MAG: hypothetical protein EOO40_00455 [Deltaproteobacteria bacterium]|nr:MAG: hypothetical protein EOO40_00455 [Deltaproteobacteria bacterium]
MLRGHGERPSWRNHALFPLYCAFPIWSFQGEFYGNAMGNAVALIASSAAVAVFGGRIVVGGARRDWGAFSAIAACLCLSLGCYQSFLFLFLAAGMGAIVAQSRRQASFELGQVIRPLTFMAQVTCAALLLNQAIYSLHLFALHLHPENLHYNSRIHLLWQQPSAALRQVFDFILKVYGGDALIYGISLRGAALLFGLAATGLVAYLLQRQQRLRGLALLGLAAGILLVPFALNFVVVGPMPARTLAAIPYVVWLAAWLATSQASHTGRAVACGCVAYLSFQCFYANSLYQADMSLTQSSDRALAAAIYERMSLTHPNFDAEKFYEVNFFGSLASRYSLYPTGFGSTAGASFFNWDDGNPNRIGSYLRLTGHKITLADYARRAELLADMRAMPHWPAQGSVRWKGDVALVKVGPRPDIAHRRDMETSGGHLYAQP